MWNLSHMDIHSATCHKIVLGDPTPGFFPLLIKLFLFRYLAICHPLYSYTMSGLRRASKIIAGLWVFALAAAIPYAFYTKVHYINHPFTNEVSRLGVDQTTIVFSDRWRRYFQFCFQLG
jgi:hypothetical protein